MAALVGILWGTPEKAVSQPLYTRRPPAETRGPTRCRPLWSPYILRIASLPLDQRSATDLAAYLGLRPAGGLTLPLL